MLLEPARGAATATEYHALRRDAGVLDLGAVGLLALPPTSAAAFLRPILPRGVNLLYPGSSASALLLDRDGRPVDLLVVHYLRRICLIETAFGRGPETLERLRAEPGGDQVRDVRAEYTVIGIEGPYAWRVVRDLLGDGATSLPLGGLAERPWRQTTALVSRTGFTGEYGYKVFVPADHGAALLEAAAALATPVGVATLETAMLEVRQPVLYREVGPDDTVLTCGYNWLVDLDHPTFTGRDALLAAAARGPHEVPVGMLAPADAVVPDGADVTVDGLRVGRVVWSAHSVGLERTLALARIERSWAASGIDVTVAGSVPATTVSSPYLTPLSWSVPIG